MTPEQRHRCMAQIRSKGTKPEMKVRQWLWAHGYRYRLNENFLALHRPIKPVPYHSEEETSLPMAAE